MALTKAHLVEMVSNQTWFSKRRFIQIVETLLDLIKETLASGEDVLITRFEKFYVHQKDGRKGRNPATGEDLMLEPGKVVGFKCSGKLRNHVHNGL